jgi:hypothetical protein
MQLRDWLTATDHSIKAFARKVKVERAMIYRYFSGTIPRAQTIRRIEVITDGAVTAQDFYASAVQRMNGAAGSQPAAGQQSAPPTPPAQAGTAAFSPLLADNAHGGLPKAS